ncbi:MULTISPECIES: chaplin [unclassified Streptomyces]|uniref:chaplin n=1 Tax=unclassified Streptomyces TaxID=2593676 RepID=UPI00278C8C03|nr:MULTISPECIES: chaplin [unclassified Streptomyces]
MRLRAFAAAAALAATAVIGSASMASAADGAGASATGAAQNSPGVLSGNVIQVPIGIPINACGNSIDLIGLLNPSSGNTCVNG